MVCNQEGVGLGIAQTAGGCTVSYKIILSIVQEENHMDIIPSESLIKRFWNKVNKTNSCWLWQGARVKGKRGYPGHGQIGIGRRDQGLIYVHQLSWIIHKGIIGNNLVLHKCDNALCVNPDHLYLGNHSNNSKDFWDRNIFYRKGKLYNGKLV